MFLSDKKTPNHRHRGAIVMGASIWIKAIRGYLHFLCGFWLFFFFFFDMQQSTEATPTRARGQLRCRFGQKDSEEGQSAGQHSCQMLLSEPVMDTHAGDWWLDHVGPAAIAGTRKGRPGGLILLSPGMSEGVSQCHRVLTTAHFWCHMPKDIQPHPPLPRHASASQK